MRKFDAKGFAFLYIAFLSQSFALSHYPKKREFINADPQSATTKPGFCYFVVLVIQLSKFIQNKCDVKH